MRNYNSIERAVLKQEKKSRTFKMHPKVKVIVPKKHPKNLEHRILHDVFFAKKEALETRALINKQTRVNAVFVSFKNPFSEYSNEFIYAVYRSSFKKGVYLTENGYEYI